MVNWKVQEGQFVNPDKDQTVSPTEFLRMTGAAESVHLVRNEDTFRFRGVFNIGNRRSMSVLTNEFTLEEGLNELLPRRGDGKKN